MSLSIEELKAKRQRWVDANKENNFEKGIKNLLTELYPDNAHFIYELLQNAEDTRAKKVFFTLAEDHIQFLHDGEELFSLKHLESITSLGTSTKLDDPTSIGKFGVGFKSVFAYTNTPEIHSGEFHFKIKDLVVPISDNVEKLEIKDNKTLFIFPFDNPDKKPQKAIQEISKMLSCLDGNVLLFLKNIHQIGFKFPDGSTAGMERIEHADGHIEIRSFRIAGKKYESCHWLRYENDVIIEDDGKKKECRIAIAYCIEEHLNEKKQSKSWRIVPLERGQVSIYFPAEKETSNLRFHIHAPFASTVARDSVRECTANDILRDKISELIVCSFEDIKRRDMLTMSFLSVLPNKMDPLLPYYEKIRLHIVNAFKKNPLTPTRNGKFAPASQLYRSSVKRIADILGEAGLVFMTNDSQAQWVANPPQIHQNEDRFLDSLEITPFGWSELALIFQHKTLKEKQKLESWIQQKTDISLFWLYSLLGEAFEKERLKINNALSIIRIEGSNQHATPGEVFFHPENDFTIDNIKYVKKSSYIPVDIKNKSMYAKSFLEFMGVRIYDSSFIIDKKLLEYKNNIEKSKLEHINDIKMFIDFYKSNSNLYKKFDKINFIACDLSDNTNTWVNPADVFIDAPYIDTGLNTISHIHGKKPLCSKYKEMISNEECIIFIDFLKKCNAIFCFNIIDTWSYNNPNAAYLRQYLKKTNEVWHTRVDIDYTVDNIEEITKEINFHSSKLLWQMLLKASSDVAKARYRPNKKYDELQSDSQLVWHLKNNAWIPDTHGNFHMPQDITKSDLHPDFLYNDDNGLLSAIGFGENAKKANEQYVKQTEHVQKIGFDTVEEAQKMVELSKLIKEQGLSVDIYLEDFRVKQNRKQSEAQNSTVKDIARRQQRLEENYEESSDIEFEKRLRTVRTSASAVKSAAEQWLRESYTTPEGLLFCQICQNIMPFRKLPKDGSKFYFERVEILTSEFFSKEHEAKYLALCPICAAKYKYFIKKNDNIMEQLANKITESDTDSLNVPIALGEENAHIHFAQAHLLDIMTIITLDYKNNI